MFSRILVDILSIFYFFINLSYYQYFWEINVLINKYNGVELIFLFFSNTYYLWSVHEFRVIIRKLFSFIYLKYVRVDKSCDFSILKKLFSFLESEVC